MNDLMEGEHPVDVDLIKLRLQQIAEFSEQLETIEQEKARMVDSVLTEEIRQKLADIEAEFAGKLVACAENIQKLETEVKQEVARYGETISSDTMQAVYNKPRITWDNSQLDGLMILLPELSQARKIGNPSVSIKPKKKVDEKAV